MNNFKLAASVAIISTSVQSYDLDKYSNYAKKQEVLPNASTDYSKIAIDLDGVMNTYYMAANFTRTEG